MLNSQLLFIYVLKLIFQEKNIKNAQFYPSEEILLDHRPRKKQKINIRKLKIECKKYFTLNLNIGYYSKPNSCLLLWANIEKIIAGIPSKAQIMKNS